MLLPVLLLGILAGECAVHLRHALHGLAGIARQLDLIVLKQVGAATCSNTPAIFVPGFLRAWLPGSALDLLHASRDLIGVAA